MAATKEDMQTMTETFQKMMENTAQKLCDDNKALNDELRNSINRLTEAQAETIASVTKLTDRQERLEKEQDEMKKKSSDDLASMFLKFQELQKHTEDALKENSDATASAVDVGMPSTEACERRVRPRSVGPSGSSTKAPTNNVPRYDQPLIDKKLNLTGFPRWIPADARGKIIIAALEGYSYARLFYLGSENDKITVCFNSKEDREQFMKDDRKLDDTDRPQFVENGTTTALKWERPKTPVQGRREKLLREFRKLFEEQFKITSESKKITINDDFRKVVVLGYPLVEIFVNEDMTHKITWVSDRKGNKHILNHHNFDCEAAERTVIATLRKEEE